MKIDLVRTIIAIGIGALIGWGFYALAQDPADGQPLGIAIGAKRHYWELDSLALLMMSIPALE